MGWIVSSIASFYRVPRAQLAAAEGGIAAILDQADALPEEYLWSGYVLLNLLVALDEAGVSLGAEVADEVEPDDETGAVFFATADDLAAVEQVDLNKLDGETLADGLDLDADELREAVAESITLLHELISATPAGQVLVILVG